jgi:uncharacterized membrane protein
VFAIAITLLVIDIHRPTVGQGQLLAALGAQWPMYIAYVASFVIIGIWWANHHELFEHFVRSDHMLMLLNTLHLMCIGIMPFTTAVLAEYVQGDPNDARVATAVYVGVLLLAGLTYNLVWHYASSAKLLRHGLSEPYLKQRNVQGLMAMGVYLTALVLTVVNVWVSLAICFFIAIYYALPSRRSAR